MKTKEELAANNSTLDELCKAMNADSLCYLSHEGLLLAANETLQQVGRRLGLGAFIP